MTSIYDLYKPNCGDLPCNNQRISCRYVTIMTSSYDQSRIGYFCKLMTNATPVGGQGNCWSQEISNLMIVWHSIFIIFRIQTEKPFQWFFLILGSGIFRSIRDWGSLMGRCFCKPTAFVLLCTKDKYHVCLLLWLNMTILFWKRLKLVKIYEKY